MIDPLGQQAAKFRFNSAHKIKSVKIRAQKYRYQYRGNQTTVTDENANTSTFTQNAWGITTSVTNNEGFTSSIILNNRNQITELWHNDQQQAQITYDDNGRPSRYDINGKPTALEKDFQQYSYQYDDAGRITLITGNDDTHISYRYDEKGNLIQRKNNTDNYLYDYTSNGDVIGETIALAGKEKQTRTLGYNDDGLLTSLLEKQQTTRFSYDTIGKLSSITFANGEKHQYQYDKLGFRTHTNRSDKSSVSYVYDSLGNLNTVTNTDANTDINNHLFSQKLIQNQDNQLIKLEMTEQPPLTIKYTNKGNPKSITQGEHITRYYYDKLGRLTGGNDSISGPFDYDYQPSEVDIRVQLDDRTRQINSLQSKATGSNQNQSQLLYARMIGSPWQAVVWRESLGKFLVPSPASLNAPDVGYQSAKQRRRLYNAIAQTQTEQYEFDKASNSFFLPPEYQSANCHYFCTISQWTLQTPLTARVGEQLTFSSVILQHQCMMFYYMDTEGATSVLSTDGAFSHSFNTPGLKKVSVRAAC